MEIEQLTLCNCDTVWKEAPFFFLCLVSGFEFPAETEAHRTYTAFLLHLIIHLFSNFHRLSNSYHLSGYQSLNQCSSRTVQLLVCWRISGTVPPPSHSEDLCSYPASQWCCTAPVARQQKHCYCEFGFYFASPAGFLLLMPQIYRSCQLARSSPRL